jgi:hypothetical protein
LDRKTSKPDSMALSRFLSAVRSCGSRGCFRILKVWCEHGVGVLCRFAVRVLGLDVFCECAIGFSLSRTLRAARSCGSRGRFQFLKIWCRNRMGVLYRFAVKVLGLDVFC